MLRRSKMKWCFFFRHSKYLYHGNIARNWTCLYDNRCRFICLELRRQVNNALYLFLCDNKLLFVSYMTKMFSNSPGSLGLSVLSYRCYWNAAVRRAQLFRLHPEAFQSRPAISSLYVCLLAGSRVVVFFLVGTTRWHATSTSCLLSFMATTTSASRSLPHRQCVFLDLRQWPCFAFICHCLQQAGVEKADTVCGLWRFRAPMVL